MTSVDTSTPLEATARPRVFLSYSSADRGFAETLRADLKQRGVDVTDTPSIQYGESVSASIAQAIADSEAVVVLLSRAASKSDWVSREIAFALSPQLSDQPKRVIPLLIEVGAEPPPFITDLRWIDMSTSAAYDRNIDDVVRILKRPPTWTEFDAERTLSARKRMIEAEIESLRARSNLVRELVVAGNRRLEQLMTRIIAGSLLLGTVIVGYAVVHWRGASYLWTLLDGVLAGAVGTIASETWLRRGRK